MELDHRCNSESGAELRRTRDQLCDEYPLGFWLNERDDCQNTLQSIRRRPWVSPMSSDLRAQEDRMNTIQEALAQLGFTEEMEYAGPYCVHSLAEAQLDPVYYPVSPTLFPALAWPPVEEQMDLDDDNLNIDPGLPTPTPLPRHPERGGGRRGAGRTSHLPDQYELDWEEWALP